MGGDVVRVEFWAKKKEKSCTVFCRSSSSKIIRQKTFIDSSNDLAITKARRMVLQWRRSILDAEKTRCNDRVVFYTPDELIEATETGIIVLPLAKWDAFDEAANKAGMGLFKWLEAAGDFYLLATTKKGE